MGAGPSSHPGAHGGHGEHPDETFLKVVLIGARGLRHADRRESGSADEQKYVCVCEIPGKPGSRLETAALDGAPDCPAWGHDGEITGFAIGDLLEFSVRANEPDGHLLGKASRTVMRSFRGEIQLSQAGQSLDAYLKVAVTVGSRQAATVHLAGSELLHEALQEVELVGLDSRELFVNISPEEFEELNKNLKRDLKALFGPVLYAQFKEDHAKFRQSIAQAYTGGYKEAAVKAFADRMLDVFIAAFEETGNSRVAKLLAETLVLLPETPLRHALWNDLQGLRDREEAEAGRAHEMVDRAMEEQRKANAEAEANRNAEALAAAAAEEAQAHRVRANLLRAALRNVDEVGLDTASLDSGMSVGDFEERNKRFQRDLKLHLHAQELAAFKVHTATFQQCLAEAERQRDSERKDGILDAAVAEYAETVLAVFAKAQETAGEGHAAKLLSELLLLLPEKPLRHSLHRDLRALHDIEGVEAAAAEAQGKEAAAVESREARARAAEARMAEKRLADARAAEAEASAEQQREHRAAEAFTAEARVAEEAEQAARMRGDERAAAARAQEVREAEAHATEARKKEARAEALREKEARAAFLLAAEARGAERRAAKAREEEAQSAEGRAAEARAAEAQAEEKRKKDAGELAAREREARAAERRAAEARDVQTAQARESEAREAEKRAREARERVAADERTAAARAAEAQVAGRHAAQARVAEAAALQAAAGGTSASSSSGAMPRDVLSGVPSPLRADLRPTTRSLVPAPRGAARPPRSAPPDQEFGDDARRPISRSGMRLAAALSSLGAAYREAGDLESALEQNQKALVVQTRDMGDRHPETATAFSNVGACLRLQGKFVEAFEYYQTALEIRIETLGEEHPATGASYTSLGALFLQQGDLEESLEHYCRALEITRKAFGDHHPDTASSHNDVGAVLEKQGELDRALTHLEEALRIQLETLGDWHPATGDSYNNVGAVLWQQNKLEESLKMHQEALEIRCRELGEEHADTALSYGNVGVIFEQQGRFVEALEHQKRALQIRLQVLGEKHSETAASFINIGIALERMGKASEALENYRKAQRVLELAVGRGHPWVEQARQHARRVGGSQGRGFFFK